MQQQSRFRDRGSHLSFFDERNWVVVHKFWRNVMQSKVLHPFLSGTADYGVTSLIPISDLGRYEFESNDPRFKRKTFAIRFGYDGTRYNGYQKQKGVSNIQTVEDDIENILQHKVVAAGRTDKNVSAISQVLSFSTYEEITAKDIVEKIVRSEQYREAKIGVWDCQRVPRKFHALFSATWRRYMYLFPLAKGKFTKHSVDVDIDFVQKCLAK